MDISYNYIINRENIKKNRKKTAVELPIDISNITLPKYVVYYNECYNHEKNLWRNYFKIEAHPFQKYKLYSSKSSKFTIKDKLLQIKEKLENLENLENLEKLEKLEKLENLENLEKIILPKHVYISTNSDTHFLIYDNKSNITRQTYKMKLPINYNLNEYLPFFLNKIKETKKAETSSKTQYKM